MISWNWSKPVSKYGWVNVKSFPSTNETAYFEQSDCYVFRRDRGGRQRCQRLARDQVDAATCSSCCVLTARCIAWRTHCAAFCWSSGTADFADSRRPPHLSRPGCRHGQAADAALHQRARHSPALHRRRRRQRCLLSAAVSTTTTLHIHRSGHTHWPWRSFITDRVSRRMLLQSVVFVCSSVCLFTSTLIFWTDWPSALNAACTDHDHSYLTGWKWRSYRSRSVCVLHEHTLRCSLSTGWWLGSEARVDWQTGKCPERIHYITSGHKTTTILVFFR